VSEHRFPEDQYPEPCLRNGGPLLDAFNGVRSLLLPAFPENRFKYRIVQPRMSPQRWQELANVAPMIGMSIAGWNPSRDCGQHYRGDVSIALFLLVRQAAPEDLLLGTDTMPGLLGVMNVAIQYLHGKRIPGLGAVQVRSASNLEACEWINERTAIATLNVVVENVGYNPARLTADMADFTTIQGTWQFGDASTEDIAAIGGNQA
jgi:hypothetical protein